MKLPELNTDGYLEPGVYLVSLVDQNYLVLYEYPPGSYAGFIDFFCQDRDGRRHGILEVNCSNG